MLIYGNYLHIGRRISNTVTYVNPHFKSIFKDLKVGQSLNARLLLDSKVFIPLSHHFSNNPQIEGFNLVANGIHTRAAIALKKPINLSKYSSNHPYPDYVEDFELKGVGNNSHALQSLMYPIPLVAMTNRGFQDASNAVDDLHWTEYLASKGVRVVPHIAHIRLNEIYYNGRKYSLDQARESKIISTKFEPVVIFRGFGVRDRIQDLTTFKNKTELVDRAIKSVSKEFKLKKKMSYRKYSIWFAKTLGKQIKLMNNIGFHHYTLHPHQVTLDCRILDFAGSSLSSVLPVHLSNPYYQKLIGSELLTDFSDEMVKIMFTAPKINLPFFKNREERFENLLQTVYEKSYASN